VITTVLLAYAVVAGSLGVRLLSRMRWLERSPGLGILARLVVGATIPLALLGAALSILTATSAGHSAVDVFHACIMVVRSTFAGPLAPSWAGVLGLVLVGIVLRVPVLFVVDLRRGHLARQAQRSQLWLVATRRIRGDDLLVVDHPLPLAFCLPGRARTIIVSTSAVASLTPAELTAVLAHERAHLRGHHHLILAWARSVAKGLWFLPDLRRIITEQARLLEMAADDRAVRATSAPVVAAALLRLVNAPTGEHALGAVEHAVAARIARLASADRPIRRITTSAALAALTLLAIMPAVFVSLGWVVAGGAGHCPIT
jgi:Zn-dependent protease with chaperone function